MLVSDKLGVWSVNLDLRLTISKIGCFCTAGQCCIHKYTGFKLYKSYAFQVNDSTWRWIPNEKYKDKCFLINVKVT